MKSFKKYTFMVLILAMAITVITLLSGKAHSQAEPQTKKNCSECHETAANEVKESGGKHRSVPCAGCHLGHAPEARKALQKCSRCHLKTKKAHFELDGCRGCHKNPHTPLNISFADIKGNCVTCHSGQVAELKDHKSKHSALECSTCHNVHRKFPQCTQCHKPHSVEMAAVDCKKCHKAHVPKLVTYAADTPSKDCTGCHKKAFDVLKMSATKHANMTCASCHKDRHRMIPACNDCHGSPHLADLMVKFPKCGDCHKIAHDLNNWPVVTKNREMNEEVTREAGKKKKAML